MKSLKVIAIMVLLVGSAAQVAWARTWRVELNGSGEFRDIQPAVEAATSGDTIRIGVGWYQQVHTIVAPAWTAETIVAVTKDNLTFIGAGAGQTLLGKSTYYAPEAQFPKVICSVEAHDVSISEMTILNMHDGIYWWQGHLTIRNCTFTSLANSVICWVGGGEIEDSRFELRDNSHGLACSQTDALNVTRCVFIGRGQGFTTGANAHNISISDCEFRDNTAALIFDRWSTGSISSTTIVGSTFSGAQVANNSHVNFDSVQIVGGEYGLMVSSGSVVNGVDVVLEETTTETIVAGSEAHLTLHNSHILPSAGVAVRCYGYFNAPVVLELGNNYWGTTDISTIDNMIVDGNDDPSVHCTVQYLPIANGPVPTESTSWGDLKASFR